MPLTIQDSRILIKTSTTTTEIPETAPSNDHTDGTWNTLDIYKGEMFINTVDNKIWMRSDVGIVQIGTFISNQANEENYAVASGTDTYTATLTPALTAYTAGNVFAIKIPNANTGASTININGLGAKDLKLNNAALSASAFTANTIYLIAYDGTDFDVIGGGGGGGSGISGLTTNELVYGNSATTIASLAVATYPSLAELAYVKGVTSAIQTQLNGKQATGSYEVTTAKDATGGYAGLTLFKINFKNAANTFTSFFTNSNTAARTYTFQDSDDTIVGRATTDTLTNKRITKRVVSVSGAGSTPSTNIDNADIFIFTALAANITSMTTNLTGTPTDGQLISFEFTDNGTARTIAWGASFASTGTLSLPTTTVISTRLRVLFQYASTPGVWEVVAIR